MLTKAGPGDAQPSVTLVAVLEAPRENAVSCDAPGCVHVLYARILVVQIDSEFVAMGSKCFFDRFVPVRGARPSAAMQSRPLTPEGLRLLIEDAQALYRALAAELPAVAFRRWRYRLRKLASPTTANGITDEQRGAVELTVRRLLSQMPEYDGVNFNTPGFRGLLLQKIDDFLRGRFPSAGD
jgi:hypothetical protein